MNNKKIDVMVYLDRSAQRKVVVIPSRIDLPLGRHEITWRLADSKTQKLVSVKLVCDDVKPDKTSNTDDTWTMVLTNNFEDDPAILDYIIALEYQDRIYTNETKPGASHCNPPDGNGCNDTVLVAWSIRDSIHNYPV